MGSSGHPMRVAAIWWLAVLAVSLATRAPFPVDETRYLAVAWEMWLRGDYLVPHLNGQLYSHKPPMMFWLIHLGWAVFGVSDWWPRIAMSSFGLAALALAGRLARMLWPDRPAVAAMAPLVAGGSLLWVGFNTMVMFDLMLSFFVLLAIMGVLLAARAGGWRGWLVCGAGIGFGVLAKGPVVLVHVLPVALLAPWWVERRPYPSWGRWYRRIGAAVLMGATIALCWAIPAAIAGGEAFRDEIFWGQSANRMVKSFAHRQPLWWYLPQLPLILFPWLFWLPVWRSLAASIRGPRDHGVRFVLIWVVPVFIAFSLISGKQWHYLLPVFPAVGLLVAKALDDSRPVLTRAGQSPAALALLAVAVALAFLPPVRSLPGAGGLLHPLIALSAALVAAAGVALLVLRPASPGSAVVLLGSVTVWVVAALHIGLVRMISGAYDVAPVAQRLAALQSQGVPIAHVGKYHGQFQFAGRLALPLEVIDSASVRSWAQRHPQGMVVGYTRPHEPPLPIRDEYAQPYRGQIAHLWPAAEILRAGGARTDTADPPGPD
ncbi:MAG: glycosyltransferase family 39 protein [Pseudomonadota bacterium]